ncbi:polyketide synthase dehydratase domain-containing protein [Streptomyces noursei]|uniref:polyketide synthase dehydratase domain-containing protein n=1 Tax=Streptomyces noursei TaxID=1971 RepID=UPI00045F0D54|nr:polyketide synthase dehydratase domain-containing protein [Streptomyces noursei]AIA05961.1 polyketide synthase [Streptomyces noursei]
MFTAQFDLSQRNPFVAGHVVRGRALMPGLAYVDLILQVFAKHGHRFTELELRNLTLTAPLAVPDGASVPLTVTAQEDRPGVWRVEVTARPPAAPPRCCTPPPRCTAAPPPSSTPASTRPPSGPRPARSPTWTRSTATAAPRS